MSHFKSTPTPVLASSSHLTPGVGLENPCKDLESVLFKLESYPKVSDEAVLRKRTGLIDGLLAGRSHFDSSLSFDELGLLLTTNNESNQMLYFHIINFTSSQSTDES